MKNVISDRPESWSEQVWQAAFHFICRPPEKEVHDDARYYSWRQSQTEIFFNRFGPRLDFNGKNVLDFGCGMGSTSFFLGQRGAKKVIGIDIDQESLGFARKKLAEEYIQLAKCVSFYSPDELPQVKFDLVISQDCFEHYDDPVSIMNIIRGHLVDNGRVAIGFSPLWKWPWGGHIGHMTKFPWAHLIFPERVIMRERRRYRPNEDANSFSEMRGGLNKMTCAKFLATMHECDFSIEHMAINVSKSRLRLLLNALRRIPFCCDYFTKNIYAVVRLNSKAKV